VRRGVPHEFGETARFVAVLEEFVADIRIVHPFELRCLLTKNMTPNTF
jgi:hypothetical protein